MPSHEWIDERSLALHEAVAARLEERPELVAVARENLRRWMAGNPSAALREWQQVLDKRSISELLTLLRSRSERAARLRQSSPFAGVLDAAQRRAIFDEYESRRP